MKKIKIAFIKYAGCASGGTEKFLQVIAANLNKNKFEVDYFYCDATPYIGWQFEHPDTDDDRVKYLTDNNVNLIKFNVEAKDVTTPTHEWINTDFWNYFNEENYDIIQIARAGHKEYPFYKIKNKPIVDSIWINSGFDNQENIKRVFLPSKFSLKNWKKIGGDYSKALIVPIPVEEKKILNENYRNEFSLNDNFIFGFHQRTQDEIFSEIPLAAYSKIMSTDTAFLMMGGSKLYNEQAIELKLINFFQLEFSESNNVEKFLNTLNVFSHGRKDGETFGLAVVEAMRNSLPIVSHKSKQNNAHIETIGDGGRVVNSVRSFSKEMKKLQNNNKYYKKRSLNSRSVFLDNYEKSNVIEKIENVYLDILANL